MCYCHFKIKIEPFLLNVLCPKISKCLEGLEMYWIHVICFKSDRVLLTQCVMQSDTSSPKIYRARRLFVRAPVVCDIWLVLWSYSCFLVHTAYYNCDKCPWLMPPRRQWPLKVIQPPSEGREEWGNSIPGHLPGCIDFVGVSSPCPLM